MRFAELAEKGSDETASRRRERERRERERRERRAWRKQMRQQRVRRRRRRRLHTRWTLYSLRFTLPPAAVHPDGPVSVRPPPGPAISPVISAHPPHRPRAQPVISSKLQPLISRSLPQANSSHHSDALHPGVGAPRHLLRLPALPLSTSLAGLSSRPHLLSHIYSTRVLLYPLTQSPHM